MDVTRRGLLALGAGAALAGTSLAGLSAASAADYPARTVRLVVPFPPGGTTDVVGRLVASALSEELGKPVIVDNRGGAGGVIGADNVAKSPPDGYTLMVFHIGMVYGPALYASLPYDVLKDFSPVGLIGIAPSALVVTPSLPVNNVQEFIALAKSKPGALNFGSAGVGTSSHLAPELFNIVAGVKTTHVPYKGGGPALTGTMGGEVQFMIETAGSLVPFVNSGKLKILGVSTPERFSAMPNVPTIAESGLPDYVYSTWYGMWAPAGTPPDVVKILSNALSKVLATEKLKSALQAAGIDEKAMPPDQFAALIKADLTKWTKIIKDAGITAQ
ncbi:tripartite tricarboxylate transporter substrate binding protein [Aquabacter sp. CN5-332]|uniref:Bug family tripartite tricarboxylate transporter substrate binding protein n=1 Tax=Aquabacter sp. CN5-332 TaxID=3156608 RepID=UPI0032B611C1